LLDRTSNQWPKGMSYRSPLTRHALAVGKGVGSLSDV